MHAIFSALLKTTVALALLGAAAASTVGDTTSLSTPLPASLANPAPLPFASSLSTPLSDEAQHIELSLARQGYTVVRQEYTHAGQRLSTIEVSVANLHPDSRPDRIFIIGASASGAAAVIELATRLKDLRPSLGTEIKFVFFVNEDAPGLAHPFSRSSNFIAFVGSAGSSARVRATLAAFRDDGYAPPEGFATPTFVEGITLSDHRSYSRHGYSALMITDAAYLRYPYSHTADAHAAYASMTRIVAGLARVIEDMAAPRRS